MQLPPPPPPPPPGACGGSSSGSGICTTFQPSTGSAQLSVKCETNSAEKGCDSSSCGAGASHGQGGRGLDTLEGWTGGGLEGWTRGGLDTWRAGHVVG